MFLSCVCKCDIGKRLLALGGKVKFVKNEKWDDNRKALGEKHLKLKKGNERKKRIEAKRSVDGKAFWV
jgi:hypothetical protein